MRHRYLFAGFYVLAVMALIWPVYAWFGGIRPFILGLPLSFAWIVGWLIAMFFAMIGLYLGDNRRERG